MPGRPPGDLGDAWDRIGGFSAPSQMPGSAYGISAFDCITGSRLAEVEGSICHYCYARRGRAALPSVQESLNRKKDYWHTYREGWKRDMIDVLNYLASKGDAWFRWYWSGDLLSEEDLGDIVEVARWTRKTAHWLPTREPGIVKRWLKGGGGIPQNLVIRISAPLIEQIPKNLPEGTVGSTTHAEEAHGLACPVDEGERPSCGDCRACWDLRVPLVSYRTKYGGALPVTTVTESQKSSKSGSS